MMRARPPAGRGGDSAVGGGRAGAAERAAGMKRRKPKKYLKFPGKLKLGWPPAGFAPGRAGRGKRCCENFTLRDCRRPCGLSRSTHAWHRERQNRDRRIDRPQGFCRSEKISR